MDLFERARKYVEKLPVAVAGQGGHDATFHVACILVQGFGFSPDQAMVLLAEYNQRCMPPWTEKELRHKLMGADKSAGRKRRGWLVGASEFAPNKQWQAYHSIPEITKRTFDSATLARFAGDWAKRVDLIWLANRSLHDPATVSASRFLSLVYPEGEKVCVFTREYAHTLGDGVTLWPDVPAPEHGPEPRACGVWFLPQPVDGGYHPTDEGDRMSCRNHRAVTAWRYMVIESDQADMRHWLGAVAQLPLRLTALYTSGTRSIHALVQIDAPTKGAWDAERDRLKGALTVLGADPKTLTAVRLSRLPGCLRHGKMQQVKGSDGEKRRVYERYSSAKLQKLLYLNPRPALAALVDFFPRRDVVADWCRMADLGVADSDETGGAVTAAGLSYYSGVSSECRVALAEFGGEA